MNQSIQLRWSDVWILVAIYNSSTSAPADLPGIIAAADCINHAVPTIEELGSGLFRLKNEGLILEVDESLTFRCTTTAIEKLEALSQRGETMCRLCENLEKDLGAEKWIPGERIPHPGNTEMYPKLNPGSYAGAVQKYAAAMRSRS